MTWEVGGYLALEKSIVLEQDGCYLECPVLWKIAIEVISIVTCIISSVITIAFFVITNLFKTIMT